jgi:hypothetical protein
MRYLRLVLAALVLFLASFLPARAAQKDDTCVTQSTPIVVNYANVAGGGTGSISITYQVCFTGSNYSNFYWTSTMSYSNVSWGGGYSINGTVSMQLNFTNNAATYVEFNGGPLTYTIGGTPYAVTFNQLMFNFTNFPSVGTVSGSVVLNGVTYSGQTGYWGLLFH